MRRPASPVQRCHHGNSHHVFCTLMYPSACPRPPLPAPEGVLRGLDYVLDQVQQRGMKVILVGAGGAVAVAAVQRRAGRGGFVGAGYDRGGLLVFSQHA